MKLIHLAISLSLVACSSNSDIRTETAVLHLTTVEALNRDQAVENDSISNYLTSTFPESQLEIGEIRRHIHTKTTELKEGLINYCGGRDDAYRLVVPQEEKKVYAYMIEQNNGEKFQELVNSIVSYSNEQGIQQTRIAMDGHEMSLYRNYPDLPDPTFVDLYFSQSTLIDALISIEAIEAYVLQVESIFLNRMLIDKIRREQIKSSQILGNE